MTDRVVLKPKARSLCPECVREIDATIVEAPGGVFMEKTCAEHGSFRALVERDAAVYRRLMNPRPGPRPPIYLVIPVTHRCNLACKMCYLPDDGVPDPPRAAVERIIGEFPGDITFSGGEPTLREDLPQLIEYAARSGRKTCVATNGLLMNRTDLVKRLADAGLSSVLFSMNGLDDTVFRAVEDAALLQAKSSALQVLREAGVKVMLSTTVVPGVNEGQLAALAGLLAQSDIFWGWRLRSHSPIGRNLGDKLLYLSDMLELVCGALRLDPARVLRTIDDRVHHGAEHLYFNLAVSVGERWEVLGHTTVNRRVAPGARPAPGGASRRVGAVRSGLLYLRSGARLLSSMPPSRAAKAAWLAATKPSRIRHWSVNIFAWSNVYNLDLDEVLQNGIYHVGPRGVALPFFHALLLNERRPDWNWG